MNLEELFNFIETMQFCNRMNNDMICKTAGWILEKDFSLSQKVVLLEKLLSKEIHA